MLMNVEILPQCEGGVLPSVDEYRIKLVDFTERSTSA